MDEFLFTLRVFRNFYLKFYSFFFFSFLPTQTAWESELIGESAKEISRKLMICRDRFYFFSPWVVSTIFWLANPVIPFSAVFFPSSAPRCFFLNIWLLD